MDFIWRRPCKTGPSHCKAGQIFYKNQRIRLLTNISDMKILRVISSMHPNYGGPCQGIRNSVPALEAIGIHNEVVCLDDPQSDYLGSDPFTVYAIGQAKRPWGYSKKLVPWLLKNSPNYDAIIVHGLWQFASYGVFKALKGQASKQKGKTIPYFVMPHGMLDPYFQNAPGRRLKAIRNLVYWKLFESKVVKASKGLLFTCEEELLLARQTFKPYAPSKELNVGYGIVAPPKNNPEMVSAFKKSCPEIEEQPYLLFLSRIHPKKGLDLLLEAYKEWAYSNDLNNSVKLVIAGPGLETAYGRQLLQQLQSDKKLQENVFFTGMLSGNSKWGAFYGCDAFVLNSHQENFGVAIVEALACGKPVLISNKVNIWREILTEGAGFVAEDTFSGTVGLLLNWAKLSPEEKLIMGKNAETTFEKFYAIRPAAENLKKALKG